MASTPMPSSGSATSCDSIVDDVHYATFYSDECGDFLPRLIAPMRLVINTAIGGDFLPPPDETTVWPQEFLIDWVRVYEPADGPGDRKFTNGDFETGGGALAGWHVFGNRIDGDPNVLVQHDAVRDGKSSLKLSGQRSGGENYSGISQGISVVAAQPCGNARCPRSLAGEPRQYEEPRSIKIEFYNRWGDYFGGPAMLSSKELPIADAATPADQWETHELVVEVPAGGAASAAGGSSFAGRGRTGRVPCRRALIRAASNAPKPL